MTTIIATATVIVATVLIIRVRAKKIEEKMERELSPRDFYRWKTGGLD